MRVEQRFEKVFQAVLWVGVICFLLAVFVTNLFHFNYKMNADIGAEAILGRLIWESGQILPDGWYGSNEVRLLCAPNLAALFYGLCHNMNLAQGLACCVMTVLICINIGYFLGQLGMAHKYRLLMVFLCLMLPSGFIALELTYLFASYYAIHVIVLFFTLAVYGKWVRSGEFQWGPLILSGLLAFCLGVQGVRGILVIYGPMTGMELIRRLYCLYERRKRQRTDRLISLWVAALLFLSFLGTLAPISIGQGFSRNIRNGFRKLIQVVLPDMGRAMGFPYTDMVGEICLGLLLFAALMVLAGILLRMLRKKFIRAEEWIFLILCSSPVVTALIVAFTTVESSQRYYFILIFAVAYGVVLLYQCSGLATRIGIAAVISAMAVVNFSHIYLLVLRSQEPASSDSFAVVQYLEEHGYDSGYATFENANTMTVLTNGGLLIAPVASVAEMDICKWLSSSGWYVPNVPFEKKTVYIVTEAERAEFGRLLKREGENQFRLLVKIGKYSIYCSDYNFSNLGVRSSKAAESE